MQGGASKHVGGANRTIIKLAQQLLINPAVALAEEPIGKLATVENVYDLVRGNIESEIRDKIDRIPAEVDHPLAQLLELALEGRRRVKEQLKKMGSFEFYHTSFSYQRSATGEECFVGVPEQGGRDLISTDPLAPGAVYTASVSSWAWASHRRPNSAGSIPASPARPIRTPMSEMVRLWVKYASNTALLYRRWASRPNVAATLPATADGTLWLGGSCSPDHVVKVARGSISPGVAHFVVYRVTDSRDRSSGFGRNR